jgi:hypothetical protein
MYVFSVTMSILRKIESGWMCREWLISLRWLNLVSISLSFLSQAMPGVRGNERADRLAGMGVIFDGRAMDHADMLHALNEAGRVDSLADSESDTMERLKDGQVKLGAARYEHHAGSQKQIVNQMRTGTVSHQTFLNVLERRSENLWVCPVWKDDNLSTNH